MYTKDELSHEWGIDTPHKRGLFFELFSGLPRQGPGSAACTRRALDFVPELSAQSQILDVGSGTGAQTLVLAESSPARILAVDSHPPYIAELTRTLTECRLTDRVRAETMDMRDLKVANGSVDLLWCEGAIYNVGIEGALERWQRLLRPNGHMAFTEACWQTGDAPTECRAFWQREYPAMRDAASVVQRINAAGYAVVEHFPLPTTAWWNDYYRPLQSKHRAFPAAPSG